jgi:hypothetical protein
MKNMKKFLIAAMAILAIAAGVNAQARYNGLNIEFSENYRFFNSDFGNGNLMKIGAEWLPTSQSPFGTISGADIHHTAIGLYYSSTINSWEDKRQSLDTSFNISDFQQQNFGISALLIITKFQNFGDIAINIKTGPSFFNGNSVNKIKYNVYIDSTFSATELKTYSEKQKNLGWDLYTKITRFNRDNAWAFRNSLEISYSMVLESKINRYEESTLIGNFPNKEEYFSIVAESNIGDINLSNTIGLDPRINIGFANGGGNQLSLGFSLSLVPRIDKKGDILNDALTVGYEYHRGIISGGQVYLKTNLSSLVKLF